MAKEKAALAAVIGAEGFDLTKGPGDIATAIVAGLAAKGFVVRFSPPEAEALRLPEPVA